MSSTIDFGIDLGTTNSCVARCEDGGVRIFSNSDQMQVTPSAVYVNRAGRRVVGLRAQLALSTDPGNVVMEFKRSMGQNDLHTFSNAQQRLSPEDLSAEILKSLREDVRRQTGTMLTAAVITVPAAFGTLQCEATARAARLAGIDEVHLLQEPIAAAIGYGVKPQERDQYWLVFDLGGGTLDIAVVSTRDGRLNVLEHKGNNLRGGKDIDRAIVQNLFLPAIASHHDISTVSDQGFSHPLLQALRAEAERTKIALSTTGVVKVCLSDVVLDFIGEAAQIELEVSQQQLASLLEPILLECVALAREAIVAARLTAGKLNRILLVGGPTQMPILRARLSSELSAPVDFSLDPMTVVARGAALYAATLARDAGERKPTAPNVIRIKLAFEPVSVSLTCRVDGQVDSHLPGLELKLDAASGAWTSGWLHVVDKKFDEELPLKEGEVSVFRLALRDAQGKVLQTDLSEFKIRNGLVPSAPLLPHSISVEVAGPRNEPVLDVIFARNTSLPAEKKMKYRTVHALIPGKASSNIYIKVWEGEFLEKPDANQYITCLRLTHDGVTQRVPEGSEIDLTIKIDVSRLITASAFLPQQQCAFNNLIYLAIADEADYSALAVAATDELPELTDSLQELADEAPSTPQVQQELEEIRAKLFALELNNPLTLSEVGRDTEEATRFVVEFRTVRGRIFRLLHRFCTPPEASTLAQLDKVRAAIETVEQHGDSLEKQAMASLRTQYERAAMSRQQRLLEKIVEELTKLRLGIEVRLESFWREWFVYLSEHEHPFANHAETNHLLARGRQVGSDWQQLKEIVRSLWHQLPDDDPVARHAEPSIRKYF